MVLFAAGCGEEKQYPSPTDKFFVNDFADVMDDADETDFYSRAAALDKATTAQVVIVTVDDLSGADPAEYALELGREWGVGSSGENNGVVILLSVNDRNIYIAVGYGLEGALPDSKAGRIIDVYGLEYLKNDNFSKGLLNIGNAVVNEIYIEYGLEPEDGYASVDNIPDETNTGDIAWSWIIMIVIIILLSMGSRRFGLPIFIPFGFGGRSSGRFRSGGGFGGFSGGGGSFGGGGAGKSF